MRRVYRFGVAMQTLADIRALLTAHGLAPRHALGQNFLIDHNLIAKLVDASGVGAGSLVLEIGPGTGALTDELLARGCRVVACELDSGLAGLLRERYARQPQFRLIEGDCLAGKHAIAPGILEALGDEPFSLVANLPYNVATPLILTLLVNHPRCEAMHVTVQREVADRLRAKPGTREYGPLAVLAFCLAKVTQFATLPPECFWPRPEVTSAMVSLVRRDEPLAENALELAECCTRLFAHRRKQLRSVLGRDVAWPVGVAPEARAESLSPALILDLCRALRDGYRA